MSSSPASGRRRPRWREPTGYLESQLATLGRDTAPDSPLCPRVGYDVATVAEWVGHERASTTLDVYVKPLRSRGLSREAVDAYLGPCPWDGYPMGYPTRPRR